VACGQALGDRHLLDGERAIEAVHDGGLHDGISPCGNRIVGTIPRKSGVGIRGGRGALSVVARTVARVVPGW
jgi:hypothetical protein